MIRTVLADDHHLFTDGLERLLTDTNQFEVIHKFTNPFLFINEIQSLNAHLIIMDIEFGSISGLDLLPRIRLANADIKIVIISMHQENVFSTEARSLGADGYFIKNVDHDVLIDSLKRICNGEKVFPITITRKYIPNTNLLSEGELQILKLMAQGFTSEEIANQLMISKLTEKTHRKNMLQKLNVSTDSDLIIAGLEKGLIQ